MASAKASVRVYPMAATDFSLSIRDGMVVLMHADPTHESQHWYKDEQYGERVKDEFGLPSFALINMATGLALRHATGQTRPVQLTPYNSHAFDDTILWTESNDPKYTYQAIRPVNNHHLNLDAFKAENPGGAHDGTIVGLWEWNEGANQRWRIAYY